MLPDWIAPGKSPQADWLKVRLHRIVVPSWLVSTLLHAGLFALLLTMSQWRSCRGDFGGDGGSGFRTVGLRVRPAEALHEADADSSEKTPVASPQPMDQTAANSATSSDALITDQPPIPVTSPSNLAASNPLLGLGPPPTPSVTGGLEDLIKPFSQTVANSGATSAGGTVSGGTSFLGIEDVGRKFVYVIDRSSSMEEYGAFRAAKEELRASVERLNETQQFQVIFYSNEPYPLSPGDKTFSMFFGNERDKLQARQQIAEVAADGGTNHFPALQLAFEYDPDVIYLLTDGAKDTAMTSAEMEKLRRRNRNGTRVHCVEFGQTSSPLTAGNFLAKFAEQNDGQYRYLDVSAASESRKFLK